MADEGMLKQRLHEQGFRRLSVLQDFTILTSEEEKFFHAFLALHHPLSRMSLFIYAGIASAMLVSTLLNPERTLLDALGSLLATLAVLYIWHLISMGYYMWRVRNKRVEFNYNAVEFAADLTEQQRDRVRNVSWWLAPVGQFKLKDGRLIVAVKSPTDALLWILEDLQAS